MKLHEIIEANESYDRSILVETILPYKNALYAYYFRQYGCDPFLMVTSVSNAAQYARIEPINEMYEAVDAWVSSMELESEEESEAEREIIMHYSILLSRL